MKVMGSVLETLSAQGNSSVAGQFWAATICSKNVYLLTTTGQPFVFFGTNEELRAFCKDCLHHKLYVYKDVEKKEGVSFGMCGLAFLNHAIQHTQNVHDYPKDQRPPCEDAIFERKWGSVSFPVTDFDDKCFGVVEFIMDKPKDTFNDDILAVSNALQHAGLQFSFLCNPRNEFKKISGRRKKSTPKTSRKRITKTSVITEYRYFVPYMGVTKKVAAEKLWKKLEKDTAKEKLGKATTVKKIDQPETIIKSTFGNLREKIGLPEWPMIRNSTAKATCVPNTQMNQTVAETSSCLTSPSADITSFECHGFPRLSPEKLFITDILSAQENGLHQNEFADPSFLPKCSDLEYQNNNAPSVQETETDQVAFETSDINAWIESEQARPDFMPGWGEMENQNSDAFAIKNLDFMDEDKQINIDHSNANLISNNIIWDTIIYEPSWEPIYNPIQSAPETGNDQIEFETSGDSETFTVDWIVQILSE